MPVLAAGSPKASVAGPVVVTRVHDERRRSHERQHGQRRERNRDSPRPAPAGTGRFWRGGVAVGVGRGVGRGVFGNVVERTRCNVVEYVGGRIGADVHAGFHVSMIANHVPCGFAVAEVQAASACGDRRACHHDKKPCRTWEGDGYGQRCCVLKRLARLQVFRRASNRVRRDLGRIERDTCQQRASNRVRRDRLATSSALPAPRAHLLPCASCPPPARPPISRVPTSPSRVRTGQVVLE